MHSFLHIYALFHIYVHILTVYFTKGYIAMKYMLLSILRKGYIPRVALNKGGQTCLIFVLILFSVDSMTSRSHSHRRWSITQGL